MGAQGWDLAKHVARALALAAMVLAVTGASAAAAAVPGHAQTFTYGSGSTAHDYIVYTPRGWRPWLRMPLLVMLHGCQTTALQQMAANLYNPLADQQPFRGRLPGHRRGRERPARTARALLAVPGRDRCRARSGGPVSRWRRSLADVMRGWDVDQPARLS